MRRILSLALAATLLLAASARGEAPDGKFHIAIITDSRGSLINVIQKKDAAIKGRDGTTETLKSSDLWPSRVAAIPGVEVHFPTKGKRDQEISAIPRIMKGDERVYDLLIVQCGHDDYFRPEVNTARMKQHIEAGEVPPRFVEDLKTRQYNIRGSEFENWVFETIHKQAKKVAFISMNVDSADSFERDRKDLERFKSMKVFDAIVELPMDERWAPEKTFDGAHYNAAGHAYVAEHVVPLVEKMMKAGK